MKNPIRINDRTPSGGDYSEAFYLDNEHNLVEPDEASVIIIKECLNDGTVINTTYATTEKVKNRNDR